MVLSTVQIALAFFLERVESSLVIFRLSPVFSLSKQLPPTAVKEGSALDVMELEIPN